MTQPSQQPESIAAHTARRGDVRTVLNVTEVKRDLSRLLDRVTGGEDIVIARQGRPVARIVPIGGSASDPAVAAPSTAVLHTRLLAVEAAIGLRPRGDLPPPTPAWTLIATPPVTAC